MHCLKCGKDTMEKQVFCDGCLADMQKYPVKPGTAVHLPRRDPQPPEKKTPVHRREATPAEQNDRLRGMIRWLAAAIAVLSVLLLLTGSMLIHTLNNENISHVIGKNYTTSTTGNQP